MKTEVSYYFNSYNAFLNNTDLSLYKLPPILSSTHYFFFKKDRFTWKCHVCHNTMQYYGEVFLSSVHELPRKRFLKRIASYTLPVYFGGTVECYFQGISKEDL